MKLRKILAKINVKNVVLSCCFLIVLNLLYPLPISQQFSLKPGDIAPRDVIAPHTFYIHKSRREIEEDKKKARETVFPVLRRDNKVSRIIGERIDEFFESIDSIRKGNQSFSQRKAEIMELVPSLGKKEVSFLLTGDYTLLKDSLFVLINEVLYQGIIDSVSKISLPVVVILGEERPTSITELQDFCLLFHFFNERAAQMFPNNSIIVNSICAIANQIILPNLIVDDTETTRREEEAAAQVTPTKGIVQKGEIIVRAHEIVTHKEVEKLSSLAKEIGGVGALTFVGRNIIYIIAILALFLYLHFFSSLVLSNFWKLFLLVFLMIIVMGVSSIIISFKFSWYLIPVALFGILASLLLGIPAAIAGVIALAILIVAYSGGGFEPLVLFLFPGIITVFVSSLIRKPSDFYMPIICISGAYIFIALGIELIKMSPAIYLLHSLSYAIVGGAGSAIVAFGLLPIFEKAFKITTPITLLEYANPDHPILRDLFNHAPGTYLHSMAVANLAEAAARPVGANPLLARIGAYYHDIGKLRKPDYFVENQRMKDLHRQLTPELNARVIISHVRDGVEIAEEQSLPKEIVTIINEHHGTTLAESLYNKAKEKGGEVNELDFRYIGPIPHTKESAIVMLADTIEAAARTLSNPVPSKIKGLVEDLIEKKIEDGQFAKVNLSMEEIGKIRDSFIPTLIAMFHQRIAYTSYYDKNSHNEPKKSAQNKQKEA